MMLAKGAFTKMMAAGAGAEPIRIHAAMCRNAGVTTSTELVGMLLIDAGQIQVWRDTVDDPAFPARMVLYNLPTMPGSTADYDAVADAAVKLREIESDKLRAPGIKLVADGSIQGWTAVMLEPGYYTGEDHGLLLFSRRTCWPRCGPSTPASSTCTATATATPPARSSSTPSRRCCAPTPGWITGTSCSTPRPRPPPSTARWAASASAPTSSPTTSGTGATSTTSRPWAPSAPAACGPAAPRWRTGFRCRSTPTPGSP